MDSEQTSTATKMDLTSDVEWVYQNIALDESDRSDPPSPGAIWLLQQTLADPTVLRQQLMQFLRKAETDKTEVAIEKDCQRTEKEIRALLKKIREAKV